MSAAEQVVRLPALSTTMGQAFTTRWRGPQAMPVLLEYQVPGEPRRSSVV
ncbi:MAG TPA: hypothetical protein VEU33_30510 [Archangium sp.]|nr:hypothetical protein [Archangium sp.]